jgi:prepilin-type processing-associated H-X9-DG protein
MNGFQDRYALDGTPPFWRAPLATVNETAFLHPVETILLGEKQAQSTQFYLLLESDATRYLGDLEESRHGKSEKLLDPSGAANYTFADGSVRLLRYGKSLCPINLWAITEAGRMDYVVCRVR